VAASGNDGHQGISYPAALNECVAVGALGMDGFRASFSNYGSQQELITPGVDIASTVPGGSIGLASGTSMASPQVAGVAALVLGTDTSLTAAKLRSILDVSAIDMGPQGRDIDYGYGLLNAKRALDLAATMQVNAAAGDSRTRSGAVVLRKGGFVVPEWAGRAAVYDCTGRQAMVQSGRGCGVELGAGTWFVRLDGPGRSETRKLLVLD
jgi:subtilisin family serine protease